MEFVIDASVALKLVIEEADSALARRLALGARQLLAPDLLLLEAANALSRHVRLQTIGSAEAARALGLLADGKIDLVEDNALALKALELSLELRHPAYDCVYLALAIEEDARVVTADLDFVKKVAASPYAKHIVALDVAGREDFSPAAGV